MKNKRRDFIKTSGLAGLGLMSINQLESFAMIHSFDSNLDVMINENTSMIGLYGSWAASLMDGKMPSLSFRGNNFSDINEWRSKARKVLMDRLGVPDIIAPKAIVKNKFEFDGLYIEELTWQLPYGRPTEATVLKPIKTTGKLPGILAFHDHCGNKYFGKQKITRTSDNQHPMMKSHQSTYYSGLAWANEIAKQGYVVIVPDAFPFESRRVWINDVQEIIRKGLSDKDHDKQESIDKYNDWAGDHEQIMAKSLYCAGTSWPAVFFREDQIALDILSSRDDVEATRIGCCGLSGGGMRSVFLGGLDDRIKCAIPVGFMTTWKDFLLNKSYTHTWMTYVPMLPKELDFPEILGLRAPLPTLVLNDIEDQLFTLQEMKRADAILSEVYKKADASNHYKCSFYPGPHKFDSAMQKEAFAWFDKWLK